MWEYTDKVKDHFLKTPTGWEKSVRSPAGMR